MGADILLVSVESSHQGALVVTIIPFHVIRKTAVDLRDNVQHCPTPIITISRIIGKSSNHAQEQTNDNYHKSTCTDNSINPYAGGG